MNTQQKKFKKILKKREVHARKLKAGKNNHQFANQMYASVNKK